MNNQSSQDQDASPASAFLPIVLLLFAGSGCSALIYEIVWFQMLQLAIGSTTVSLGILLATFMGGLCIGSVLYPRWHRPGQHPLRVYAAIELGIAALGLLVMFLIPLVDRIYVAGAAQGLPGMLLRGGFAAICLLPPTILMGASLPAISRWVEGTSWGASWWGLLYGGNTAGAVFGCLLAGFYLLRVHDMATGTYTAVAINLTVALASYLIASRAPASASAEPREDASASPAALAPAEDGGDWIVYLTIGLSGACALGAEVVWTRLMGMLLGLTVYAFSIILAVFLVGLAIGSAAGALLSRSIRPRLALGVSQILAAFGIAWTALVISQSLPYWPINPLLAKSPWDTFQLDMARTFWAMLPATLFWGASFPLALASLAGRGKDSGRVVGSVYAANTLGTIAGALLVSMILVPWIGTLRTQQLLVVLSAASALVVLVPHIRQSRSVVAAVLTLVSFAMAGTFAYRMPPVPGGLIMWGRQMMTLGDNSVIYTAEGRNSSLAISEYSGDYGNSIISIGVNGHVEATTQPFDMKLQRMVGHLPAILHPNPKAILGIGFGAGVSAGTFTRYPSVESITVCEIEPIIPPTSTKYFAEANYEVMLNPKTRIVYDDARHYLMTTTDKFDIIASDPLDVFAKGTAALYTVEYFEAVKRHLKPGGFFTLYVPLYESDVDTVRSELATFFEAFPNATVWNNTLNGTGYDMVFMGQADPLEIDVEQVDARLNRPDYRKVVESLRDIGFYSVDDLFATYSGRKADLGKWVAGAPINRDGNLKLQYMAGWGINSQMEDVIYRQMMRHRERPVNLLRGSPERVEYLLSRMQLW